MQGYTEYSHANHQMRLARKARETLGDLLRSIGTGAPPGSDRHKATEALRSMSAALERLFPEPWQVEDFDKALWKQHEKTVAEKTGEEAK